MFKKKDRLTMVLRRKPEAKDAVFMGWQKLGSGEVFALYNITAANHPSFGSTVTIKTLHDLNLQVPAAPLPQGPVKEF